MQYEISSPFDDLDAHIGPRFRDLPQNIRTELPRRKSGRQRDRARDAVQHGRPVASRGIELPRHAFDAHRIIHGIGLPRGALELFTLHQLQIERGVLEMLRDPFLVEAAVALGDDGPDDHRHQARRVAGNVVEIALLPRHRLEESPLRQRHGGAHPDQAERPVAQKRACVGRRDKTRILRHHLDAVDALVVQHRLEPRGKAVELPVGGWVDRRFAEARAKRAYHAHARHFGGAPDGLRQRRAQDDRMEKEDGPRAGASDLVIVDRAAIGRGEQVVAPPRRVAEAVPVIAPAFMPGEAQVPAIEAGQFRLRRQAQLAQHAFQLVAQRADGAAAFLRQRIQPLPRHDGLRHAQLRGGQAEALLELERDVGQPGKADGG